MSTPLERRLLDFFGPSPTTPSLTVSSTSVYSAATAAYRNIVAHRSSSSSCTPPASAFPWAAVQSSVEELVCCTLESVFSEHYSLSSAQLSSVPASLQDEGERLACRKGRR
ncbi:hypothetical protein AXG93_2508s1090 [Marchantia polymorpha subsp. ruderalis]|uniref:Uncharacterized protein n=1 Tax=Marchantia polymorpha subsp. ruderalis TaxID=1480154 RepID=A0A176WG79_MARPO|nr:hypothetical protein AXG93_2508s1090 [Marchantia polymorpha subsp. ruderalis]